MKWTRHQFAPTVSVQQVVNRAVAGGVPLIPGALQGIGGDEIDRRGLRMEINY